MKNRLQRTATLLALFIFTLTLSAFIIKAPAPDFYQAEISNATSIFYKDINTHNTHEGTFKSLVNLNMTPVSNDANEFYGYRIEIKNHPQIDAILIGISNQLISKIELWNKGQIVSSKQQDFIEKLNWGKTQNMSVELVNKPFCNETKIHMRFYKKSGFVGDIASIDMDLSDFHIMEDINSISLIQESDSGNTPESLFKNLSIWKNI